MFPPFWSQVCQISVQPPVNGELILRFQQLQSRLATLKIENEEVKWGSQLIMQAFVEYEIQIHQKCSLVLVVGHTYSCLFTPLLVRYKILTVAVQLSY